MSNLRPDPSSLDCNTVMVSGGFDPLHPGHLVFFREARKAAKRAFYPRLLVAVDSDEFVARKHPVMLPARDRAEILHHVRMVHRIVVSTKMDVCDVLHQHKPGTYCVGPDHADLSFPEKAVCEELGIDLVVLKDVPKMSSTELISRVQWSSRNLPVTVSAVLTNERRHVLLGRSKEGWCLPGGFVEPGEDLEDSLDRELLEEIHVSVLDFTWFHSFPGRYHDGRQVLACYFYGSQIGTPEPGEELTELRWASRPEKLSTDCDTEALKQYLTWWGTL